ncbi:hypothetical protein KC950_04620 [Candidatus Saccharibacteria bacterium]|nr:hypothetical protein [Candidatus Saccharibacteria bacterium]
MNEKRNITGWEIGAGLMALMIGIIVWVISGLWQLTAFSAVYAALWSTPRVYRNSMIAMVAAIVFINATTLPTYGGMTPSYITIWLVVLGAVMVGMRFFAERNHVNNAFEHAFYYTCLAAGWGILATAMLPLG